MIKARKYSRSPRGVKADCAIGVMSGLIGAHNKFGQRFDNPDPKMQGIIVSIYGESTIRWKSNEMEILMFPYLETSDVQWDVSAVSSSAKELDANE
jgi:hypothetical protein